MVTIKAAARPTLEQAAKLLEVAIDELDASFGVVTIDPDAGLHTVLVLERAPASVATHPGLMGPFSNPRIEPARVDPGPPTPAKADEPDSND